MPKIRTELGKSTLCKVEFLADQIQKETNPKECHNSDQVFGPDWTRRAYSQGHCHAHNEEKSWKNQISWSKTVPSRVTEEPRWIVDWADVVDHNHAHHGEPPVNVQGFYPNLLSIG